MSRTRNPNTAATIVALLSFVASCTSPIKSASEIASFRIAVVPDKSTGQSSMQISGLMSDSALYIKSYTVEYERDTILLTITRSLKSTNNSGPYFIGFALPNSINKVVLGEEIVWMRAGEFQVPSRFQNKRLTDPASFEAKHQEAIQVVSKSFATPSEFYVEIEEIQSGNMYVMHLWHQTAFLPQNRGMNGNPGGQCRDVWYDAKEKRIIKTLFWQ